MPCFAGARDCVILYTMLLIVHGGAGSKKPSGRALKKLAEALSSGYEILKAKGAALDAVTESIRVLEDSGLFNAGMGGNLQIDGVRRLDASVIEGKELQAGSVIGLEGIRNPVLAARLVMTTPHVMLTNTGAYRLAAGGGLPLLPPPDRNLVEKIEKKMRKQKTFMKIYEQYFSTVGAVALDGRGNVAAGASTGGVSKMLPGRVGDTPIIGAGVYADNSLGAVSCTGMGEYIIRLSLAKEVCMNLGAMTPLRAVRSSLKRLTALGGAAGLIVLNRKGGHALMHTTPYMAAGFANRKGIFIQEVTQNTTAGPLPR